MPDAPKAAAERSVGGFARVTEHIALAEGDAAIQLRRRQLAIIAHLLQKAADAAADR
jgi:hypothetical protein